MSKDAYNAFPIMAPVTPDDYAKHSPLSPAPTEFYYAPAITRCSVCDKPAHASETDDLDRCEACAAAAGEPHVRPYDDDTTEGPFEPIHSDEHGGETTQE
jgi:hypothetical protein